ncbi:MAG TPA: UDP-2,3-diacylglucosamine diphosphatase LpxI [Methyloceanibacter sp.]|jgi:UDP-2,3-diacylglucosamine hydrolase|nr:UDP-2,3-diacylglucosamine diphosphatase LpxI [Methyloceanibacter sp.]
MSQHRVKAERDQQTSVAVAGEGPLGIIAGGGTLPATLAEAALAKGRAVHILGIRGEADQTIEHYPHTWLKWGEVGKLFTTLTDQGCRDLVIIGAVTRPDLAKVRFDFGAVRNLPFLLSLGIGGDDHVLSSVVRFLEGKGYRVHGAGDVAPELLAAEGPLGVTTPSAEDRRDIETGFRVVAALGRLDVGQAAVVVKGRVLAVEAAEGTDAMLARCVELRKGKGGRNRGQAGVLVKAPKPGQEERVDLPTIGSDTIKRAAEAGLAGIAVAAGRVLIADREAAIAAADSQGLYLVGQLVPRDQDA